MSRDNTPNRWVSTGISATPREHDQMVALAPQAAGEDSEPFLECVREISLRYPQLPNISPHRYAYNGSQFVYDASSIDEWLKTDLGIEIHYWLERVAGITEHTVWTEKRNLNYYWISKLGFRARLNREPDAELIKHWWLYRDPRWIKYKAQKKSEYYKTDHGKKSRKKTNSAYYLKTKATYAQSRKESSKASHQETRSASRKSPIN